MNIDTLNSPLPDPLDAEEKLQRFNALSLIEYNPTTKTVKIDGPLRNQLLTQLPANVGLYLKAENMFSKLAPDEQELMQRVLTRLVKLGPDANSDTRARVKLSTLNEPSRRIVKKLLDEGILTEEEDKLAREVRVQFADESLIKKWSRLRNWIKDDREFLLWQQDIRPGFETWRADKRYGLLEGEELATATNWIAERPNMDQTHQTIWAYVTVSAEANRKQRWKRIGVAAIFGLIVLTSILGAAYRWNEKRKAAEAEEERILTGRNKFQQGFNAARQGDYDNAIKLYTEALQYIPNSEEIHNARGEAYSAKGNYSDAINDFNVLLQANPRSAEARLNRGLTLQKSGDNNGALNDFNAVLSLTTEARLVDSAKQQIRDSYKVATDQKRVGWAQHALYNNATNQFDILNFRKLAGDPNNIPQVNDLVISVSTVNLREVYMEQASNGTWNNPLVIDTIQPQQIFTVLDVRAVDGNGTWLKLERVQTARPGTVVVYYASSALPLLQSTLSSFRYQVTYGGPPPIPNVNPDVRYYYAQDQDSALRIKDILEKLGISVTPNARLRDPDAVKTHNRGDIEIWLR